MDVQVEPIPQPRLVILTQPVSSYKFRYGAEGGCHGGIPGEELKEYGKSFPKVEIQNYRGHATIFVELVTNEDQPMPHPHLLIGNSCQHGVYSKQIGPRQMTAVLSDLKVQCTKKNEGAAILQNKFVAEAQKRHGRLTPENEQQLRKQAAEAIKNIDRNSLKLKLTAVVLNGQGERALPSVFSNAIYCSKRKLKISFLSHNQCTFSGKVYGNDDNNIILLSDGAQKEDVGVRFFSTLHSWEEYAVIQPGGFYRQCAIVFSPPKFYDCQCSTSVPVQIELIRKSTGECSEPKDFTYIPDGNFRMPATRLQPAQKRMPQPPSNPGPSKIQKRVVGIRPKALVMRSGDRPQSQPIDPTMLFQIAEKQGKGGMNLGQMMGSPMATSSGFSNQTLQPLTPRFGCGGLTQNAGNYRFGSPMQAAMTKQPLNQMVQNPPPGFPARQMPALFIQPAQSSQTVRQPGQNFTGGQMNAAPQVPPQQNIQGLQQATQQSLGTGFTGGQTTASSMPAAPESQPMQVAQTIGVGFNAGQTTVASMALAQTSQPMQQVTQNPRNGFNGGQMTASSMQAAQTSQPMQQVAQNHGNGFNGGQMTTQRNQILQQAIQTSGIGLGEQMNYGSPMQPAPNIQGLQLGSQVQSLEAQVNCSIMNTMASAMPCTSAQSGQALYNRQDSLFNQDLEKNFVNFDSDPKFASLDDDVLNAVLNGFQTSNDRGFLESDGTGGASEVTETVMQITKTEIEDEFNSTNESENKTEKVTAKLKEMHIKQEPSP